MADLSLYPTQDILHELLSRFDAALFTGYRDLNEKQYDVSTITKGNALEIVGLSAFTQQHVTNTIWEDSE